GAGPDPPADAAGARPARKSGAWRREQARAEGPTVRGFPAWLGRFAPANQGTRPRPAHPRLGHSGARPCQSIRCRKYEPDSPPSGEPPMIRRRHPALRRLFRPCLELLEPRTLLTTLTYLGGPLFPNVAVSTIYYGSQWASTYTQNPYPISAYPAQM